MRWGSEAVGIGAAELAEALRRPPGPRPPAETVWTRLRPRLRGWGIARVGDITGLDRIGLPVAQAVRPRALSNAVTQGKGATPVAAAVGAVLECLEMAAGEDLSSVPAWNGPTPDPAPWRPLAPPGADWPDARTDWRTAWDMADGRPAPVPAAVLDTDFTDAAAGARAPIVRSSIGLGAGTTVTAAAWHGLLECVENDARLRGARRPLAVASVAGTGSAPWLARLAELGLRVGAFDMAARPGPACVAVQVMEDPASGAGLPLPAEGFACRPDAPDAFAAALAEAIQARLALISGAREDMTAALYAARPAPGDAARRWNALAPGKADAPPPPSAMGPSDPAGLARALSDAGLGPVLVVPLWIEADAGLCVVRVVAPALWSDPDRARWGP